jgi:aspartyl-tRNA(Asn)/glutamyl-tRNA(Gln) amidotransferase subunit A
VVAYASSLDQVGPIARSARDAARLLGVIAGHDPGDATSATQPVDDYEAECGKDVTGLRVGVVRGALAGCDAEVRAAMTRALEQLGKLGCELIDVELPNAEHAVAVYYLIAPAEASSNLARFDGMRYGPRARGLPLRETYRKTRQTGFGIEVKRRIMLGTYALSAGYYDAFYLKAAKVRTLIRRDFERAFERCDLLLIPTAPSPAFRLGAVSDPLSMYQLDIFTLPPSLAGVPAINTPVGLSAAGMPIGAQLVGPHFSEARLVRAAHALEQVIGWKVAPKLPGDVA